MENIVLFHKLFEEIVVLGHVYLRGGGNFSLVEESIKLGKQFRIPTHVIRVGLAVHGVGVEQDWNISIADPAVGLIDGGFTGDNHK